MPFDLKPCPFCGSPAEFVFTPWDDDARTGDDGSGWVQCTNLDCGAELRVGFHDEAEEKWNRRAAS